MGQTFAQHAANRALNLSPILGSNFMAKKKRSDSVYVQSEIMQAVARKIEPPAFMNLTKDDLKFFDAITRARLEWSQIDLVLACHLARCFYDLARLESELIQEGFLLDGKPNPKAALVEMLSRRSLALSRSLNVHAGATVGRARDQVNKNSAFRRAQQAMEDGDDDLIAKPH